MNKQEYLKKLNSCLKHLPKEDREDALHYYEEYFEDMELSDSADILEHIDTPEHIAKKIITECTERHIEDQKTKGGLKNNTLVIWMIILAIFAMPIAIPVALVLILCFVALLLVLFSFILSVACVCVACFASSFSILFLTTIAPGLYAKLFCIGCGFVLFGLGILLLLATIGLGNICIRGVACLFKKIFLRKKVSK